ncbi:MAG: response regulator [Aestuariibaculum sp.]
MKMLNIYLLKTLVFEYPRLFHPIPPIFSRLLKGAGFVMSLNIEKTSKTENIANDRFNILVAEDNKPNQLLLKKILEVNGYNCTVASNGLEAVNISKNKTFDLILMDIMMPKMDGVSAAKKIGKLNPNIPIIAVTAIAELDSGIALDKKFCVVLKKPINKTLLLETIRKTLAPKN